MSDLRERVARVIYEEKRARLLEVFGDTAGWPEWETLKPTLREIQMEECDPYIALVRAEVLEEAARVAEGPVYRTSGTTGEVSLRGSDNGNWSVPMPISGFKGSDYGKGRYDAAAAIRALKDKPHG